LQELAGHCLASLREWSRLQDETGRRATWKANRLADDVRQQLRTLAASEEGRRAIESFLDDEEPGAQAWAAAQVLFWDEPKARAALERLEAGDRFPFNFNAQMTLKQFDEGRLRP
jgi:hypothetical protein